MEEDVTSNKLRPVSASQLAEILNEHKRWLAGDGGRQADLRYSNLSGSDLRDSNLRDSDLRYSNLSGSDLSGSDLRGSDLRDSDLRDSNLRGSNLSYSDLSRSILSGSIGLLDASKWIADHLTRCRGGVYAYKSFGSNYTPPADWRQEPGAEISETVNLLPTLDCACGVNVATLDWCLQNNPDDAPIWKVMVKWEWMAGGVIPYNTDGKFRVPRAKLIEIMVPGTEDATDD